MRILGRLAVAAGATAVILLVAPSANAAGGDPLNGLSKAAGTQEKAGLPLLGGLGGGLPLVGPLLQQALAGATGAGGPQAGPPAGAPVGGPNH